MQIVQIYHLDPSFDGKGGAIRYINDLITNLLNERINVKLIGVQITTQTFRHYHFEYIPIIKNSSKWYMYLFKLFLKLPYLKLPTDSIIHVHRIEYIAPFMLFYRNYPLVYTIHGDRLGTAKSKYSKIIYNIIEGIYIKYERMAFHRVSKIIAVSHSSKESFIRYHPSITSKITTIPVGINIQQFSGGIDKNRIRAKYSIHNQDILILFVGVLGKVKNLGFLINSFKLISSNENVKLVIVGDGDEKNGLMKTVEDLNLHHKVIFTGEVAHSSINEFYSISDLLVLTSKSEGSPNVIREALASGIPVVSTNVGDVKEIIDNKYLGIVIDDYNERKFADAILKTIDLIKNEKNLINDNCKKAAEKYSSINVTKKIISVYESLNMR